MKAPSEDQLDTILSMLRGGGDFDAVVTHQGLDPAQFDEWLRRPRNKGVAAQVKRASAQADLSDLSVIASATNTRAEAHAGTWQAAKARLEMRRLASRERELLEINAIAGC